MNIQLETGRKKKRMAAACLTLGFLVGSHTLSLCWAYADPDTTCHESGSAGQRARPQLNPKIDDLSKHYSTVPPQMSVTNPRIVKVKIFSASNGVDRLNFGPPCRLNNTTNSGPAADIAASS
ncbi:hypothetical protein V8F20_007845 [Naviculisporaceae sp. PSN 640]